MLEAHWSTDGLESSRPVLVALRIAGVLLLCAFASIALANEWPQWRGPDRDGVWRETGVIEQFEEPQLPIVWRAEISSGYSGPTVANGLVYVTDRLVEPKQSERVHCFDAMTGSPRWKFSYECPYRNVGYEAGPRASVIIDEGRAYALGTMGHLHCLDATTGELIWKRDLNQEYKIRMPIWGIAAAPIIENDLVIVQIGGEDGACLTAFDKKTGQERWKSLDDGATYSAPIIIAQGGKRVLICWTAQRVVGLDPGTGELYWEYAFPSKSALAISTPVVSGDLLFLTAFYDGSLMLRLAEDQPSIEKIWRRAGPSEKQTEALHSIISTPLIIDGYVYGACSYGELRCLDADNGDRIWESLDAVPKARWANIHFVQNDENVWLFNEKGELIISRLSPAGFEEISRAKLIKPTKHQLSQRGGVCWAHPAFAYKHVYARNDEELVCASLAK
jgi:outer membrane protein assembly factor BamB